MGGYDDEELRTLYNEGHFLATDNYWREGMTDWGHLGDLLPPPGSVVETDAATADLDPPGPSHLHWIVPTFVAILLVVLGVVATVTYFSHKIALAAAPTLLPSPTLDALKQQPLPVPTPTSNVTVQPQESASTRATSDESAMLLKEIQVRTQACRDAEKDMLLLGFDPNRLTSLDEIEKRRQSIQTVLPRVLVVVDYLAAIDHKVRDDLVEKGVNTAAIDRFIAEMHHSGHQDDLMTYWKQEGAICADIQDNLNLLKQDYGKWHLDSGTVVFNDTTLLAAYRANIDKLKSDIATQQTAQAAIQAGQASTGP